MTEDDSRCEAWPTVSIVMAAYNAAPYIAEAIQSALDQTWTDFELLVVDDGSTDETARVVERFRDDRIRLILREHTGQPATKNTGIRNARGRLIAFLDADDVWLSEKLARQLPLFEQNPRVGVVYSRRSHMTPEGHPLDVPERACFRGRVTEQLLRSNAICFSSSLVRQEVFAEIGLFDETLELAIDWDMWLRCSLRYEFDFVDEPLVKYRVGHASLSRRSLERLETASRILERFLEQHGSRVVPARVARHARADLCCNRADVLMRENRLSAWMWYAKALGHAPRHGYAWKSLLSCWWPDTLKRAARRLVAHHSAELKPER